MAGVDYQRDEVTQKAASWRLVRDAVAGSEAVKAGGHLPEINPHDSSTENRQRNADRLKGAVYFNATGRTLSALTGIAFSKWPEVELPAQLDYLSEDADGSGVGLVNQSQLVVSDVMQVGRAGLLADYPPSDKPASRAQQDAGELRATIAFYPAETIINWRTIRRGAKSVLGMVVLQESIEEWVGFERTEAVQYRVLMLGRLSNEDETAPERYVVQLWRADDKGKFGIAEEYAPEDGAGRAWQEIPFQFIGSMNNDTTPDQPPMYDLADLNIAHFRNSADHEEALHFAAQPQVWVTGADEQWLAAMTKAGIYVGSRSIGCAPVNGDVKILQSEPVSALSEEMGRKVELMASLGARLITPGEVAKTATQASGEDKTAHSVLSLVCDNVSDAYRKVLAWCGQFMADSGKVDFTIGTEFSGVQFDAQQMAQALAAVQSGKLPESDFWTYCRSIGLIESSKDDDAVREELASQAPPLALDAPVEAE